MPCFRTNRKNPALVANARSISPASSVCNDGQPPTNGYAVAVMYPRPRGHHSGDSGLPFTAHAPQFVDGIGHDAFSHQRRLSHLLLQPAGLVGRPGGSISIG